jgi:hypothetical protein
VLSSADPRELDLTDLVPRAGRINHVWFIPAGTGHAQIAVAWQQGTLRCAPSPTGGCKNARRYYLALWNPEPTADPAEKKWVPHVLVRRSWDHINGDRGSTGSGSAIRLADVTGDGHDDLLITISCEGCNWGTDYVRVVATFGRDVRRIYLGGFISCDWGAHDGMLWSDCPKNGPIATTDGEVRLVFLKWHKNVGWRTVMNRVFTWEQVKRLYPWAR